MVPRDVKAKVIPQVFPTSSNDPLISLETAEPHMLNHACSICPIFVKKIAPYTDSYQKINIQSLLDVCHVDMTIKSESQQRNYHKPGIL